MPKAAGVDIGHEVEKIGEEEEKEEDEETEEVGPKSNKERAKELALKAREFVVGAYTSEDRLRDQNLILLIVTLVLLLLVIFLFLDLWSVKNSLARIEARLK